MADSPLHNVIKEELSQLLSQHPLDSASLEMHFKLHPSWATGANSLPEPPSLSLDGLICHPLHLAGY